MKVKNLPIPKTAKKILKEVGISILYPPQEEAVKIGVLKGKNLVLASPTASGKTLVSELCMVKHVIENNGKVLYLTPLRAIASEKYNDFQKYTKIKKSSGHGIRVAISTGDYDSADLWLEKYDVVICTNEKADSLLRHKSKWMNEVTLIVADEIHLINDEGRGPTLEVVLTRLRMMNPTAQILALSATIRNTEEMAEWLKARSITTDWRPVKLIEGVYFQGEVQFNDGSFMKIDKIDCKNPQIDLAMYIVKEGGQALIFAESRKRTITYIRAAAIALKNSLSNQDKAKLKSIADRVLCTGEKTKISNLLAKLIQDGTAFHHAGLTSSHRKIIEDEFRNGKLKIISATPTLAAGVNLPARMVVIGSYRRYKLGYGRYPISVLEYKQMAGRAGRPKYDQIGETILISKSEDERDYLMQSYVFAKPEKIQSKMGMEGLIRSHVLSTIASSFTHSEREIYDFFNQTFYAHQHDPNSIRRLIVNSLRYLYKENMFEIKGDGLYATKFGRRVSELYINPISGVIIRKGLYNQLDKITDLSLLHMICHTPDMTHKYYPYKREVKELNTYVETHKEEFLFPIPDKWTDKTRYEEFLGEIKCALVLNVWSEEMSENEIVERYSVQPGDLFRLVNTTDWLLYALYELGRLFDKKEVLPKISELRYRIKKGVKKEILPLVKLEGVGRIRGRILFNAGLKDLKDLKKVPLEKLIGLPLIGLEIAKNIKEQVRDTTKTNKDVL